MDEIGRPSPFEQQHGVDVGLPDPRAKVQMWRRDARVTLAGRSDERPPRHSGALLDADR